MIFLTGSSGLIGSHITKLLIDKGKSVRALKRPDTDLSLLGNYMDKVEWVNGDLEDPVLLKEALKNITTVIHCAAIVSYLPKDRELMYKINVEGTANIINAAIENNVSVFGHISSIAAIGKPAREKTINEAFGLQEPVFSTRYAKSKYLGDLEVYRGKEEGLKTFIVNPSVVLGPGDWSKGSTSLFRYVFRRNRFYTPGTLNYVDVRDVAEIVCELLDTSQHINGERYILNAGTTSYKEFFQKIAVNFQVKGPSIEASPFISEIAWRLAYLKNLFSSRKTIITKETVRLGKNQFSYDNGKIRELLEFSFRSLDQTLNWTCQELVKRHKAETN